MCYKLQLFWRKCSYYLPLLVSKMSGFIGMVLICTNAHASNKTQESATNAPIHIAAAPLIHENSISNNSVIDASINSTISRPIKIREYLLHDIDREVIAFMQAGKLPKARALITQAIEASDFTGDVKLLVNRLIIRASIDQQVGAYIGALQDLQFAFRLASSTNQQDLVADVAYIIASIHQSRNEHSIALSYAQQALKTYQPVSQTQAIPVLLLSISSLLATRQIDDAMDYLNRVAPLLSATDIAVSPEQSVLIEQLAQQKAEYFQYLGEAELYRENISESISALQIALNLTDKQSYQQLATLNLLLSQAYTIKDNMDLAIEHLVIAFKLASQNNSSFYLNQALQLHRANLLSQLNEFEAAYRVTQNLLKNRELNQPIAEIKRMLDMHANFQLNLQQQENADLKQENLLKSEQIETKQTLNKLYFLIMALLFCTCCLLLLVFIRGKKHRLSLEKIAHTDSLTNLYSRTRVLELLTYHQDLFNRNNQGYCVAIVDLDFFKKINDNYGHQTGDQVLKMFGELSKSSFRKTDVLGRIGGEEFLFILPTTKSEQAIEVFKQFNSKLTTISNTLNLEQTTTASIGLVTPLPKEQAMSIIKRADTALYEAKSQGRNRVVFGNKVVSLQSQQTEVNYAYTQSE